MEAQDRLGKVPVAEAGQAKRVQHNQPINPVKVETEQLLLFLGHLLLTQGAVAAGNFFQTRLVQGVQGVAVMERLEARGLQVQPIPAAGVVEVNGLETLEVTQRAVTAAPA